MIFQVENGCFFYGERQILKDVSFTLKEGEILAILGSNGVGKTTLLKCMMGLLKWNSGCSKLNGKEISSIPYKELWKTIAYVPQAKNAVFTLTALEMVVLGRSAHLGTFSQPKKEDEEIALKEMADVGVLHLKDKLCSQMSGGELQMVLIARALTAHPSLLVLDEPESNLDFRNQLIILDVLKRLAREKNISAVINTHYPAHALKISDKTLILNQDLKSFYGDTKQIINAENMRHSFGVNVYITDFEVDGCRHQDVVPLSVVSKEA